MKHKLQKIKEESQILCSDISNELQTTAGHMEQISQEYHRVAELSHAPTVIIDDIDRQFEQATKLTRTDVAFLFLATALQCIRQYVLTMPTERLTDQEAAKKVKGDKEEHSNRKHRLYNPSLDEIITNPVPFDANIGAHGALAGAGYLGHRGATPGHDPILGLIFGTANIATSTLTNWKMRSFHIYTGTGSYAGRDIFHKDAKTHLVGSYTIDKLLHQGMTGKEIIGVSVAKEILHLRSDLYSKKSLPLPVISAIDPKLAGKLAEKGLDMANVLDAGKQLTYALAIDTLIALIHGFFYDESAVLSRSMYEVRTRRILLYSNLIASTSNAVLALGVTCYGVDGAKFADWGGYLNTLRHIAFDTKFIREVKRDFLKNELYNQIVGAEYDFIMGDF